MERPQPPTPPKKTPPTSLPSSLMVLFMLLLLVWTWQVVVPGLSTRVIPYSEFKQHLAAGEVTECNVRVDEVVGKIEPKAAETKDGAKPEPFDFRTTRVDDPKLTEALEAQNVEFRGERPSFLTEFVWGWVIPIGFMLLIFMFLFRRAGAGAGASVLSMGKSRARLVPEKESEVSFEDVAGCEEAKTELAEVVDFLRNPGRYRALGAKIPKGVLLVGPPGTGKTLLARAVAGEAQAPFFTISGSDFVEMFVGVGAARVRDLFKQAKAKAPCIIFMDELDAIGRQRGVHVGNVNDEREQTLNALLVEMDGFEGHEGVIVLAATNRPDVLDRALLRPGRFDRQVVVDAPDLDGREAILKVHVRNKPLAEDGVDLRRIAQVTPGLSGADLANVINEAALLTARRGATRIEQSDLEEAVEKVVAGPERRSRRLTDETKRRVAYHEVGHALVAFHSDQAQQVHKISIVPRGHAALGYTMQLPEDNQYLRTRGQLFDEIKSLLGGRAAEEVVFGEVSTGAGNDLERATALARQMVAVFGMGQALGLTHVGRTANNPFLGQDSSLQMDCSDDSTREIDLEVKRLLDDAYVAARGVLEGHRDQLETIVGKLLQTETMDGEQFARLAGGGAKAGQSGAAASSSK